MNKIISILIILTSINVFADKLPERYCGTWVYMISSHWDTNPKGFEGYFPQRNKDGNNLFYNIQLIVSKISRFCI